MCVWVCLCVCVRVVCALTIGLRICNVCDVVQDTARARGESRTQARVSANRDLEGLLARVCTALLCLLSLTYHLIMRLLSL